MNAYKQMMMPAAEKPTFTIHGEDMVTLRIHGISYSFGWEWENDNDDDWYSTYISMPQGPDTLVWIEFYPWYHYHAGIGVDAAHTLYIYNGNDGTEVHIHDCVVVDHANIIGRKQEDMLNEEAMNDD